MTSPRLERGETRSVILGYGLALLLTLLAFGLVSLHFLTGHQAFYTVFGVFAPLLQRLLPNLVTNTVAVGRALIRVSAEGYPQKILESRDINCAGAKG